MRIIAAFLLLLLVAGIAYAELPAGLEISKRPLTLEERLLIEDMKANNRWIVPKSTGIARIVLEGAGCKISKNLNGPYEAYAVKCPNNVHISGAIRDEILTVKGISEAVKINADDVWNLGYQGTGQTVAVLDTGIDTTHSQLSNDITGGKNFLASPPSNFFKDDEGHGTNVAGIITSDGTSPFSDSKGIAPRAKLWVAKVCNSLGQCFTSDVVEAIEYIVKGPDGTVNSGDEPARIISMSIGVNEEQVPYWATCDVVQVSQWVNWAVSNGFVVVAAADHNGYGSGINAPACASRAIAVGAVDSADRRYSARSGTGNELDIMAPGVSVVTTSMGGTTETFDGTSAATPHVSAVIALLHQFEPALKDPHNIGMVKDALYKSAKDLGTTGWDSLHGWGRVDALAAIRKLHDPAVTAFSGPARTEKQVTVFLSGTFVNEGVFPEMFSITIKDLTDNVILKSGSFSLSPGTTQTSNFGVSFGASASVGIHTLELRVAPVDRELDTSDNVKTTTIEILPVHDIAVTSFSVPSSTPKGAFFRAAFTFANEGEATETFNYVIRDKADNMEMFRSSISVTLKRGQSITLTRDLAFGSFASTGLHILEVEALPVSGERDLADNKRTAQIDVQGGGGGATHDIAVTSFTGPASATKDITLNLDVAFANEGSATETFTYRIFDVTDSREMTSGTITLSAGQSTARTFSTTFFSSASTGIHRIEARVDAVSGETDTADNTRTISINVQDSAQTAHDIALSSFTGPASAARGMAFFIDANIVNEGSFRETFTYVIKDITDNLEMYRTTLTLDPGRNTLLSTSLTFGSSATIGVHTLEGRVSPVPGETDTTDNMKAVNINVVSSANEHDIAVTSFSAPQNATKGTPFTVYIGIQNEGRFTETFTYVIRDKTDNIEMHRATASLNPSTGFSGRAVSLTFANTASTGMHTLELEVLSVTGEVDTADNRITRTINILSGGGAGNLIHDIAITLTSFPPNATIGIQFSASVTFRNQGNLTETFTYVIADKTDSVELFRETLTLNPSTAYSKSLSLTFGSSATIGRHTIEIEVFPVPGEIDVSDNLRTRVIDILPGSEAVHDIAITSFTGPSAVTKGTPFDVQITFRNLGTAAETFNYTVYLSLSPNKLSVTRTETLAAGQTKTVTIRLTIPTTTFSGTRSLKVWAEPVPGETNRGDNVNGLSLNVMDPPGTVHDIAVAAFSGPASAVKGQRFSVSFTINNEGNSGELMSWKISDLTDGVEMVSSSLEMDPGSSYGGPLEIVFGASASTGTHVLELRISPVSGETDLGDNVRTLGIDVTDLGGAVHDVSVDSLAITPSPVVRGKSVSVSTVVSNRGAASETFRIRVQDTTDKIGAFTGIVTLAPGETRTVKLGTGGTTTMSLSIGTHSVYAKVDPLAGETNTANNKKTVFVNVAASLFSTAIIPSPASEISGVEDVSELGEDTASSVSSQSDSTEVASIYSIGNRPDYPSDKIQRISPVAHESYMDLFRIR